MNNPLSPEAPVIYLDEVDSTMLEAKRLVGRQEVSDSPVLSGTVVRAEYQSAGRGRISERRWEVSPGDGLMFTLIFHKEDLGQRMSGKPFMLLPLLCGLAVAEALEAILPESEICIKWPNDILVSGRKICGILCESSGEYFYAGIGININQQSFPQDLRRPAVSLAMLSGKKTVSEEVLMSVLTSLSAALSAADWKQNIEKRLYLIGQNISVDTGIPGIQEYSNSVISGRLSGIDPTGALLLETADGLQTVFSGELLV